MKKILGGIAIYLAILGTLIYFYSFVSDHSSFRRNVMERAIDAIFIFGIGGFLFTAVILIDRGVQSITEKKKS